MAHARIRSVTFKNGGATIRLLHRPDFRQEARDLCNQVFSGHAEVAVAGMAMVLWAADGQATAIMASGPGCIPGMLIPDFVRNRLMAERIIQWAVEAVHD